MFEIKAKLQPDGQWRTYVAVACNEKHCKTKRCCWVVRQPRSPVGQRYIDQNVLVCTLWKDSSTGGWRIPQFTQSWECMRLGLGLCASSTVGIKRGILQNNTHRIQMGDIAPPLQWLISCNGLRAQSVRSQMGLQITVCNTHRMSIFWVAPQMQWLIGCNG